MSCQLLDGKMCSCLHEKEQNKWELSGTDSCSDSDMQNVVSLFDEGKQ